MSDLVLYNYFRSSTSYRVRIALHHKELPFEYRPVHLVKEGGQQHKPQYRDLNAMGEVPTLVHRNVILAQSLPIIQYLEDVFPAKKLISSDPAKKALMLQFCENINAGLHPLQNLKVTHYLSQVLKVSEEQKQGWLNEWIGRGMISLERMAEKHSGKFCFGDELSIADCFLVPQLFSCRRFKADVNAYPRLLKIEETCLKLSAFEKSHPANQPDSEN